MTTALSTPDGAGYAIDLGHVAKTYRGKVHALRGIEMRVHAGEIFGLLGPNGAGKSTLVKILMTVIRPTRCQGTMLGQPVGHKETLRRVGYLPEHHRFSDYLTGAQVLDFYGALAKVPRRQRRLRTGELLELVGMRDWAKGKVGTYSKGMRQRVGVAQALINDPDLILLDEPTDGVDPVGRRDIRNVLLRLKERGKTVFVNSHLLSELEMVCDRVAILVQGVVSSQGTLDELTRDQQRYEIEFALDEHVDPMHVIRGALPYAFADAPDSLPPAPPPPPPTPTAPTSSDTQMAPAGAPTHPSAPARRVGYRGQLATGEAIELDGHTLRIGTTDPARVQPVLDALRARGVVVRSLRPFRPSLEDLFMRAVTDPTTGEVLAPGAEQAKRAKKGARP